MFKTWKGEARKLYPDIPPWMIPRPRTWGGRVVAELKTLGDLRG